MEQTNTFKFKGIEYTFCGFYEDKFAFYVQGKVIFIKSIDEIS